MGRRAAVVGAVDRARAGAALHAATPSTARRRRESWREQIPACARAARPDGAYDVGCLYVGVNDVRAPDWDPAAYERDLRAALAFLRRALRAGAVVHVPARPRPAARARRRGGRRTRLSSGGRAPARCVLDLRDFGARNLVMVDAVHPTAFGQIAIAERALDVLAADGMAVRVRPVAR